MHGKISIVLFLLIFALLIQNTCPHGFAGKSTVAPACSHCPQKRARTPTLEGKTFSALSHAPARLPMYVLDMPNTQPIFRLASLATPQPVIPNTYKNAAPDELLQHPRA